MVLVVLMVLEELVVFVGGIFGNGISLNFLAALSSSRSLVVRLSVGWSVARGL